MTTTETTTCDGCRRPIEDERHHEITIRGPYTYEDDPDDKHLCGPCWDAALFFACNRGRIATTTGDTK